MNKICPINLHENVQTHDRPAYINTLYAVDPCTWHARQQIDNLPTNRWQLGRRSCFGCNRRIRGDGRRS